MVTCICAMSRIIRRNSTVLRMRTSMHVIKNQAELEHWKVSNVNIMEEIMECKAKSCTFLKVALV